MTERPAEAVEIDVPYPRVRRKVLDRYERSYGETIRKFARGPRFRPSGRAPYLHILKWLTDAPQWAISLQDELPRHPNERGSVGQVIKKGWLAQHMEDPDMAKLIHYDPSTSVFSVEDPQLGYYLRNQDWGEFTLAVGFVRHSFETPYDFALSFAGEDREYARALFDELDDLDLSVFYDENEQGRIVAEDVEDFLAPIYASGADFVIVILGPAYGDKRWPRFESDQFKERIGLGRVIPIVSTAAKLSAFDKITEVGYLTFDPAGDLRAQAREAAGLCEQKLVEATQQPAELELPAEAAVDH
ncbi:MAG: TIR domain-containing protein [Thermoleophilaceae bacterium]